MKGFIILIIILASLIFGFFILKNQKNQISTPKPSSTPAVEISQPEVNIKASFKIITDNITRNFSNSKYHNRSADIFIQADDPPIVHVKKEGIRWVEFFNTLPMRLTKDCLTTGDGETFCDPVNGVLKFYLNDAEDKDLLDKEIKEGDLILIKFTSN